MSKKIEAAHRKLVEALEKHAELATGRRADAAGSKAPRPT
jgi:hypothetical protein